MDLAGRGWKKWCTAALCLVGMAFGTEAATAQTRTLKIMNVHTGEKAEIVYRRGNSYDAAGLKKANYVLRDWRKNQPTRMNPKTLDILWEVYRNTGASGYIHVICGYRSPATNSMLRSRSKGVAKNSQHTLGNAIDFYIPGIKLKTLRDTGLALQAGGVGYYPTSGSPFVHMDSGRVRTWGPTSPAEVAMAISRGKRFGSSTGTVTAFNGSDGGRRSPGLLARLFGGGADEEEDTADSDEVAAAPAKPAVAVKKPAPVVTEVAAPAIKVVPPELAAPARAGIKIVPPEDATPAEMPVAPTPQPEPTEVVQTPETIIAALPARKVPTPFFAPRPQVDVGAPATEVVAAIEQPQTALPVPAAPADAAVDAAGVAPQTDGKGDRLATTDVATADKVNVVPEDRPTDLALGIPLPTWRPKNAPQPAIEADSTALLALASTNDASDIASDTVAAVPTSRPDAMAGMTTAEMTGTIPPPAQQVAVVVPPVKTTPKTARPTKLDVKPDTKPVVVAAAPRQTRWAVQKDYVVKASATKAPSYAFNVVRTAPLEVYTAGFQQGPDQSDINRFSGKAVKFLQVARFQAK